MSTTTQPPKLKRRWYRFSLRTEDAMKRLKWMLPIALLLVFGIPTYAAERESGQEASEEAAKPDPQIAKWILQLDNDEFKVREQATANAVLAVAKEILKSPHVPQKIPNKIHERAIQGKWTVVEAYLDGEKCDLFVGEALTFSGKKMTSAAADGGEEIEETFELRPDKKPRELDFSSDGGKEKPTKCIYELSSDTLRICFEPFGKEPPKAMGTAADDNRILVMLKRVKGDDKK